MSKEITMIQNETRRRRAILEAKLAELQRVSGPREELHVEHCADPIDQVKSSTDREVVIRRLDQQTRSIHAIRTALAKMRKGAYGLCERCEEPIAGKRLDALPWARFCVTCQSAVEFEDCHDPTTLGRAA
jgi:DnaK suppressor protein